MRCFRPILTWRATPITSELQAVTILDEYDGVIKSDRYYADRLSYFSYNTESFCKEIADGDLLRMKGDLILIRDAILRGPFMFFSSTYKLDYNLDDMINAADFYRIYDNGPVYAYL